MILNESPLSQRAAEESLPLRDAFAVLFFVSVGMLFNPAILFTHPLAVLATVAIILVGKSVAAFAIVRAFGYKTRVALTISASLAQVGEFSFILAALGLQLGLLSETGQDLILAGAIISILLNPVFFDLIARLQGGRGGAAATAAPSPAEDDGLAPTGLSGHAIVIGYGRVGSLVGDSLMERNVPFLVIEDNDKIVDTLRGRHIETIVGNAADPDILAAANLAGARYLFLAIPEPFEAAEITKQAHAANSSLLIVARAHFDAEVEHLTKLGASTVIMGERQIALGMVDFAFEEAKEKPVG
jgi:CPA2 family monovalent cation:H+ antiporter-2